MNKRELLENLKEKFKYDFDKDSLSLEDTLKLNSTWDINKFIDTIIIEVLKSVILDKFSKQKAKELYWIDL